MKMRDIASLSVGVDKVGVKNARNTLRGKEKIWKQTRKQCSNNAVSMLGISKFYIVKTEWKGTRIPPAAGGKRASTMQICIADLDALRKKKRWLESYKNRDAQGPANTLGSMFASG